MEHNGCICFKLEMHDTAIYAYKTAITLNPNSSEAYFNMGITFTKQGKFNEAINATKIQLLLALIMLKLIIICLIFFFNKVN